VTCIRVYKRWSPKDTSKDNQSFCESVRLPRQAHALRPRRVWASSDDLHLWVPVGNPALIGLNLPLTALVGVAWRKRKILTCTQINKNNKSKSLSDYAQQDLSVVTWRPWILNMQRLQVKQRTQAYWHLLLITFRQVISQVKLINNNNRLATCAKHTR
jgi:hypothetical protein